MSKLVHALQGLTDERLISISMSVDRLDTPLRNRFEGDDTQIVEFMTECGLGQDLVSKLLISREVLRECVARGIQIPRPNNQPQAEDDYTSGPRL